MCAGGSTPSLKPSDCKCNASSAVNRSSKRHLRRIIVQRCSSFQTSMLHQRTKPGLMPLLKERIKGTTKSVVIELLRWNAKEDVGTRLFSPEARWITLQENNSCCYQQASRSMIKFSLTINRKCWLIIDTRSIFCYQRFNQRNAPKAAVSNSFAFHTS